MRCSFLVSASVCFCFVGCFSGCFSGVVAEGEPEGEGEGDEGEGEGEGEAGEGEGEGGDVVREFDCRDADTIDVPAGCSVDADCTTARVGLDCCGTPRDTGVNADDAAAFVAAYADCTAAQPICDCAPSPLSADDASLDDGSLGVACVAGACVTSFGDGDRDFDCGSGGSVEVEASCVEDSDCGVVVVQLDCCGSLAATGVIFDAERAVQVTQEQCAASLGECGCASSPTVADDGTTAPTLETTPNVTCVDAVCRTSFGP